MIVPEDGIFAADSNSIFLTSQGSINFWVMEGHLFSKHIQEAQRDYPVKIVMVESRGVSTDKLDNNLGVFDPWRRPQRGVPLSTGMVTTRMRVTRAVLVRTGIWTGTGAGMSATGLATATGATTAVGGKDGNNLDGTARFSLFRTGLLLWQAA